MSDAARDAELIRLSFAAARVAGDGDDKLGGVISGRECFSVEP